MNLHTKCKNCKYWYLRDESKLKQEPRIAVGGQCRKNPPIQTIETDEIYWCGEFKSKPKSK